MNIFFVITIVGSIASIIGLFLPADRPRTRVIHVVYGLAIVLLATTSIYYFQKTEKMSSVNKSVNLLLDNFTMEYTSEGFVNAVLVFLEVNKEVYPDAYNRAKRLYDDDSIISMTDKAFTLKGLLQGIKDVGPTRPTESIQNSSIVMQVVLSLFVLVMGFFLRDIYEWIKEVLKRRKPKLVVSFKCEHHRTYGTFPRNYEFRNHLALENLDEENLYYIKVYLIDAESGSEKELITKDRLKPDEKVDIKDSRVISYGDKGNDPNEAKKMLPRIFTLPSYRVEYENHDEQKYEIHKNISDGSI